MYKTVNQFQAPSPLLCQNNLKLKLICNLIIGHDRGIHIANMNIRHLKPKLDYMKILLDLANCIDVFGLCQTFLTETVENDILSISGYTFERKDRWETN